MRLFCKRQEGVEVLVVAGEINFDPLPSSPSNGGCSLFYFCVVTLHSSSSFPAAFRPYLFLSHTLEKFLALSTFLTSLVRGSHHHSAPSLKIGGLVPCPSLQLTWCHSWMWFKLPSAQLSSIPAQRCLTPLTLHFHNLAWGHTWPPPGAAAPLKS